MAKRRRLTSKERRTVQREREAHFELRRIASLEDAPTPSSALPAKRDMQEALHVVCYECGCAAGRHLASCSRSS